MKTKNMSKKQLRAEIDVQDAMIAVLVTENDLLRESLDDREEHASQWESHHMDAVDGLDAIIGDLLALAVAVGVMSEVHAQHHDG